jgi:hypothetical protein
MYQGVGFVLDLPRCKLLTNVLVRYHTAGTFVGYYWYHWYCGVVFILSSCGVYGIISTVVSLLVRHQYPVVTTVPVHYIVRKLVSYYVCMEGST